MVLNLARLVKGTALHLAATLPAYVDFEDLIAEGFVGACLAVKRFDNSRGEFAPFARQRIRGAMIDWLRGLDHLSRDMRRRKNRIDRAIELLTEALGRAPYSHELEEHLGLNGLEIAEAMIRPVHIDHPHRGFTQDTECFGDVPVPADAGSYLRNTEHAEIIRELLAGLSERSQKAVRLYFYDELKMKEIGVILGVNESRVSQIISDAVKRMRQVLDARGLTEFAQVA